MPFNVDKYQDINCRNSGVSPFPGAFYTKEIEAAEALLQMRCGARNPAPAPRAVPHAGVAHPLPNPPAPVLALGFPASAPAPAPLGVEQPIPLVGGHPCKSRRYEKDIWPATSGKNSRNALVKGKYALWEGDDVGCAGWFGAKVPKTGVDSIAGLVVRLMAEDGDRGLHMWQLADALSRWSKHYASGFVGLVGDKLTKKWHYLKRTVQQTVSKSAYKCLFQQAKRGYWCLCKTSGSLPKAIASKKDGPEREDNGEEEEEEEEGEEEGEEEEEEHPPQ